MIRAVSLVIVAAVGACSSDGDKRVDADGGGKGPVIAHDGGNDVVTDAGTVVASDTVTVADIVTDSVDGGTMADVDKGSKDGDGKRPVVIEGDSGKGADNDPLQLTVWNRVLVKAKSKDLSPADLQDLVEQATQAKVAKVRRTAGTFWLVEFTAVTPVRKPADQAKLIEALKGSGAFVVVEGDQVMKLK